MSVRDIQLAVDTVYTHTWAGIQQDIVDNIFKSNPFWYFLTQKGNQKPQSGGKWLEVDLEYADSNSTVAWINPASHDLTSQITAAKSIDPVTSCQYDWRYVTASIYRKWVDDTQNRSTHMIHSIIDTKLNNARKTLQAQMETKLFTLNNPGSDNCIEGLPNIVRDDPNPTGSNHMVGKITQGNVSGSQVNTWWNNKSKNMTGLDIAVSLVPNMRTMFNNCSDGQEVPDIIITSQTDFENYEDECGEQKSIVNSTEGDAMFQTIYFKGKRLLWSTGCAAGRMYFLSLDYLYWLYDPDVNFDMTSWKEGRSDLDRVAQILCAGNLVCSNRSRQGVLYNIGAA